MDRNASLTAVLVGLIPVRRQVAAKHAWALTAARGAPCTGCKGGCTGCSLNQGCCDGKCTNLQSDTNHCGDCSTVGAPGQVCSGGVCCPEGQTYCGGSCTNTQTNPIHCGGCWHGCNGGSCINGQCANCPPGYGLCAGTCVDLQNDANNCGSCGNVSHRARVWPAIFRRPPAAAPPGGQRSNWRGRHQVDVRSCLIARLARRTVPTHQVRFRVETDFKLKHYPQSLLLTRGNCHSRCPGVDATGQRKGVDSGAVPATTLLSLAVDEVEQVAIACSSSRRDAITVFVERSSDRFGSSSQAAFRSNRWAKRRKRADLERAREFD